MSLREFLSKMDARGEIIHIEETVSPRFEISNLAMEFDGGPILFFEKVEGNRSKVVANVCGSRERICLALKVSPNELHRKIASSTRSLNPLEIVKSPPSQDVLEKLILPFPPLLEPH